MQPAHIQPAGGMQNTTTPSIGDILSQSYIEIPEFQRGFSWETTELGEFWSDLMQLIDQERSHYFGLIVAEANAPMIVCNGPGIGQRSGLVVIDGQQRLTTSVLLIKAIQQHATEIPDGTDDETRDALVSSCEQKIRFQPAGNLVEGTPNWTHVINNQRDEFNESIHALLDDRGNHQFTTGSEKRMKFALNFLIRKISDFIEQEDAQNKLDKLVEIHNKFVSKFTTVRVTLPNDMEAPAVFEVMNNRGRPLSTLDLLKNLVMLIQLRINDDLINAGIEALDFEPVWFDIVSLLDKYGLSNMNDEKKLLALYWQLFKGGKRVEADDAYDLINSEFKILLQGYNEESNDLKIALSKLKLFISKFTRVSQAYCEFFTKDKTDAEEGENRQLFGRFSKLFPEIGGDNSNAHRESAKKYLSDIRSMEQVSSMQSTLIACMFKAESVKVIADVLREAEKTLYRTYRVGDNNQRYNYQEDPKFSHNIFLGDFEQVTLELNQAIPESTQTEVRSALIDVTIPPPFPRKKTLYEAMIGYFHRTLMRASTPLTLRSFKDSLLGDRGKKAAKSPWVRYFFYMYNRSVGGAEALLVESFKDGIFTEKDVEHIMPQSLVDTQKNKSYWMENITPDGFPRFDSDLESPNHPEARIHDIGNVVVTQSKTNRNVYKDRKFSRKNQNDPNGIIGTKKILYANPNTAVIKPVSATLPQGEVYADYAMVSEISRQYKEWRWQCIEDRKKRLTNWALDKWRLDCNQDIETTPIPLTKLYWHEDAILDQEDPEYGHKAIQRQRCLLKLQKKRQHLEQLHEVLRDRSDEENDELDQNVDDLQNEVDRLESRFNYRSSISEAYAKKYQSRLMLNSHDIKVARRNETITLRDLFQQESMDRINEHFEQSSIAEAEAFAELENAQATVDEIEAGQNIDDNGEGEANPLPTLEEAIEILNSVTENFEEAKWNTAKASHLKEEYEKLRNLEPAITELEINEAKREQLQLKIESLSIEIDGINTAIEANIEVQNAERRLQNLTERRQRSENELETLRLALAEAETDAVGEEE